MEKNEHIMKFFLLLMISLSVAPFAKQQKSFVKKSLYEGFIEKDFPFINSALDLGKSPAGFPKNNYTPRGVFIQLSEGTWACFDRDLLRVSAIWHGGDFEMNTMAQVSYPGTGNKSKSFPKIKGTLDFATGVYPGFSLNKTFKDPRKKPLGPLPLEQCSWKGIKLIGKETVLSYSIAGVDIQEQISLIKKSVYSRKLQFKANKPISFVLFQKKGLKLLSKSNKTLKLKDAKDTITVHADNADIEVNKAGQVLLTANSSFEVRFSRDSAALNASLKAPQSLVKTHKPHVRWPQRLTTTAMLSSAKDDYLVDEIKLPLPNPWRRSIRLAAIDFFKSGRAAALTFDGDVWLIDGLQGDLNTITWKRFASGIYAPLSLKIHKEEIYVFGRDQITRLHDSNKDDEADFYENYSTAFIQSMNTRDFSLDMVFANNGDIFISKGGIQQYGGKLANRDFLRISSGWFSHANF